MNSVCKGVFNETKTRRSINKIFLFLIFFAALMFFIPFVLATVTDISFVGQIPSNGSTQSANSIFFNLSTTSSLDHYAFVDFDEGLTGWWILEGLNR